jgi:CRISPR system Cascade subunit CasE
MYLSCLMLNPRHKRAQRELAQPYELHRTVLSAFPESLPPGERVLFRVDTPRQSSAPAGGPAPLLVQSQNEPDWRWADDLAGYLLCPAQCKAIDLELRSGQMLAFRLRANPTVKKKSHEKGDDPPANGVRLGLLREEEQRAWLDRKGEQHGFVVLRAVIAPEAMQTARKPGHERGLVHVAVRYDGLLRVTDAALLQEAVRGGIGSAKAFGFGLLSLGPARLAS